MDTKRAKAIFSDIYTEDAETEDKLLAIQEVVELPSYNSIKRNDAMEVLRWLIEEYI